MALIPSQVLRVAILLSYFSILCHYKALDMPARHTYGGSWKFLTFIDLVIQAVFFGLCVLIDVSCLLTKGGDSREQERQLRKLIGLRDWMMAVLAFPIGAVSVRGLHLLEPVPVGQGAGLPAAAGQLHPPVAEPRHDVPPGGDVCSLQPVAPCWSGAVRHFVSPGSSRRPQMRRNKLAMIPYGVYCRRRTLQVTRVAPPPPSM
ncbi:androgen-induced gene 1 protein isoform 3-T3 [Spinachia spinachia]